MGVFKPEEDMWVPERLGSFSFPGGLVDDCEIGAVVLGMALRTFVFMGIRQVVVVPLMSGQLLLNFSMAVQASRVQALVGMAFFAVHDDG